MHRTRVQTGKPGFGPFEIRCTPAISQSKSMTEPCISLPGMTEPREHRTREVRARCMPTENIIDCERYSRNNAGLLFVLIIKGDNYKFCAIRSKRSVEVYRGRNFHLLPLRL
jgi:hypothetical protein